MPTRSRFRTSADKASHPDILTHRHTNRVAPAREKNRIMGRGDGKRLSAGGWTEVGGGVGGGGGWGGVTIGVSKHRRRLKTGIFYVKLICPIDGVDIADVGLSDCNKAL